MVVGVDGLVVAGDRVVIRHVELSVSLDDHIGAARRRTPAHQHQDQPSRNAAELQHAGSVISLRSETEPDPLHFICTYLTLIRSDVTTPAELKYTLALNNDEYLLTVNM